MPLVTKQANDATYSLSFPRWMSNDARDMICTAKNVYGLADDALPQYKGLKVAIDSDDIGIPGCVANGSWMLRAQ